MAARIAPTRTPENSAPTDPLQAPNLDGQTPPGYDPAYGGSPIVPNPIASAWQASGGDAANLPGLYSLGNAYNLWNFGQQQQTLGATPGYSNVTDLMSGKLPQDVINNIAQQSAERGVSGGSPGSPNANAAYLAAIGSDSLKAQQLGQQEYGNLASLYPMAKPFDLSSFFVTPEQQQAANTAANTNAAAPNPRAAADAEQAALLAAIAAGKGSVPGVGPAPTIPGVTGTGPAAGLTTPPPGQTMVTGPQTTQPPLVTPNPVVPAQAGNPADQIQQAIGPNPMQGPAINPSTGAASGGFQGPAINPWTGAANGGMQGPAINPWTGASTLGSSGYQGPAIDPMTGASTLGSSGFQGPAIDPMTGASTLAPAGGNWWDAADPYAALFNMDWAAVAPQDPASGGTGTASADTSNWWDAADPWAALLNQDWINPTDSGGGGTGAGPDMTGAPATDPGASSDWWNAPDPWAALTGVDFTQPVDNTNYSTDYSGAGSVDWTDPNYYGP